MEYGNFRGDAGCSGHHSYVYQIHSGEDAQSPSRSRAFTLVFPGQKPSSVLMIIYGSQSLKWSTFDQVIPAINGVSIAVQEDFMGGALQFSRRILPEGSCFRKLDDGETWCVPFFFGGGVALPLQLPCVSDVYGDIPVVMLTQESLGVGSQGAPQCDVINHGRSVFVTSPYRFGCGISKV